MKARLRIDDAAFANVTLRLRNVAHKVPENARKTMRRTADRIAGVARNYAPEDSGALVDSIRAEYSYGEHGRLQVDLVVGGQGEVLVNGRMVDLDQYAAIIHEHYEDILVYGPGDRTEEKMLQFPGKVGSGFLTRAYEENRRLLDRDLIQSVKDVIHREGLT